MSVKFSQTLDLAKQPSQKRTYAIIKLDGVKVSFVVRKMLRSKKLTRLLKLMTPKAATRLLASLSEVARDLQLPTTTLIGPAPIAKQTPAFLDGPPPQEMDMPQNPLVFPAIRLTEVKSAMITGHSSLILAGNRIVHHDLFDVRTHTMSDEVHRRVEFQPSQRTALRVLADRSPIRIGKAASFTDSVSVNYAHWLTEVLPRMVVLGAHHQFDGIPYIVDANLHPNLYRSMNLVVADTRDIYLLPKDRQMLVSDLLYVTPTGYIPFEHRGARVTGHSHGIFSAPALQMTTELIKSRLGLTNIQGQGTKIYIRRNSHIRNLINAQEVEQALLDIGFKVIEPEKLTFDEQVRVFSSADVVVGSTGAALANIIFAQPHCKVFILISRHADMPYYYWQNMAASVGVKPTYVLGEQVDAQDLGLHSDFLIPEQQLLRLRESVQTDS